MIIYIGFSKSRKKIAIGSWLIRAYQRTEYSHCYIRIPHPTKSDTIFHASEGLVQRMSETQFDKKHRVVQEFEISVPRESFVSMGNIAHELSGSDYGLLQNFGIVLARLLLKINIRINNPFKKGWNCSELVCYMMRQFDSNFNDLDVNLVTPKELFNKLNTSNYRRRL
jgi:hypothetical protein